MYVKVPPGKGCGFVQFVQRAQAENALARMNGHVIGRQPVRAGAAPAPRHGAAPWRRHSGRARGGARCAATSAVPRPRFPFAGPLELGQVGTGGGVWGRAGAGAAARAPAGRRVPAGVPRVRRVPAWVPAHVPVPASHLRCATFLNPFPSFPVEVCSLAHFLPLPQASPRHRPHVPPYVSPPSVPSP